jgi:Glycosyltransferase family 87
MVRHPLRLAVGVWLALAVAVAVRTLVSPVSHSVFPIFAASAAHWWADQSLYSLYPDLDLFRYPPPFAVVVTPFGALGLRAGGVAWSWAGMAVYAAGLWRFARDVLPAGRSRGWAAAFLALGAVVALPALWNAQSNPLVVGLILLGASGLARRRWWTAAFLFAAATWLKLTPLLPALLLCCLWPRRLAPRFVAALAVGALLPFLTRPADVVLDRYQEWAAALTHTGGVRWPGFRDAWTAWQVTSDLVRGNVGPSAPGPIDWAGLRAGLVPVAAGAPRRPAPRLAAGAGDGHGLADAVRPGGRAPDLRLPGPLPGVGAAGVAGLAARALADRRGVRADRGPRLGAAGPPPAGPPAAAAGRATGRHRPVRRLAGRLRAGLSGRA